MICSCLVVVLSLLLTWQLGAQSHAGHPSLPVNGLQGGAQPIRGQGRILAAKDRVR